MAQQIRSERGPLRVMGLAPTLAILSLDKIKQEEKPLLLRPRIDSTRHRTVPESGVGQHIGNEPKGEGWDIIKKADVPRRRNAGLHGNEVHPPCSPGEQDVMRWKCQTFPNKKFQTGLVGSAGPGQEQEAGAKADPTLPTAGQWWAWSCSCHSRLDLRAPDEGSERTGESCWQASRPNQGEGRFVSWGAASGAVSGMTNRLGGPLGAWL
ncbi:hypothetical protein VTG60DRAFT_2979 [Thermothelomyces hinnuleus]